MCSAVVSNGEVSGHVFRSNIQVIMLVCVKVTIYTYVVYVCLCSYIRVFRDIYSCACIGVKVPLICVRVYRYV